MSRRISMAADGMRLSKPGQDAKTAPQNQLLFSTVFPFLMKLDQGGPVTLASGMSIIFTNPLPIAPVILIVMAGGNMGRPTEVYNVTTTGFDIRARHVGYFQYPAEGASFQWIAFSEPLV